MKRLESAWKGLTDYPVGLELQESAHAQVKAEKSNGIIIGLEHPRVITLGIRGKEDEDILNSTDGFEVVKIKRGGQAVLHNPGQLVIYPVIPIRKMSISVKCYVDILEKATQSFLEELGVKTTSGRLDPENREPGLYTAKGKIAFFGVQVRHGITLHGVAINVSNNLNDFSMIRSCGHAGASLDKIENYQVKDLSTHFEEWVKSFNKELINFRPVCV